jgi:hypothetical protein
VNDIDQRAIAFLEIKAKEAMAAEFRWGVAVGYVLGFAFGLVAAWWNP